MAHGTGDDRLSPVKRGKGGEEGESRRFGREFGRLRAFHFIKKKKRKGGKEKKEREGARTRRSLIAVIDRLGRLYQPKKKGRKERGGKNASLNRRQQRDWACLTLFSLLTFSRKKEKKRGERSGEGMKKTKKREGVYRTVPPTTTYIRTKSLFESH